MSADCPNCRGSIPLSSTFLKTAWSRWPCPTCGAILAVDVGRRMWIVAIMLAVMAIGYFLLRIPEWYLPVAVILVPVVSLSYLERVVVIERTGYSCRHCGYDLRGQENDRCPECGRAFERAEIFQQLTPEQREEKARRLKRRKNFERGMVAVIVALVVLQLGGLVAMRMWQVRRAAMQVAPPAAVPAPANANAADPVPGD